MQDDDLHSEIPSAERQSFLKLTRELAGLPLDKSAAALETDPDCSVVPIAVWQPYGVWSASVCVYAVVRTC